MHQEITASHLNPKRSAGKYLTLIAVMVGTIMAPLDSSVVNISLPTLSSTFHVGITSVEWVVLSYLLTLSVLLLSFGRLGDILGHKRIYVTGFVFFTLSSLLCGNSQTFSQLVVFRVLQAIGGAMIMSIGPAIITDVFPGAERGKALGFTALSVSAGLTIGPALGGFILGSWGWRWIFYINLPIGVAATTLAFIIIKEKRARVKHRFDILGAALALVALLSLLVALSEGQRWGWGSPLILILFLGSLVFAGFFIYAEKKVSEPMLDLSLFRSRLFAFANVSALISYFALFSVMFLLPFYFFKVRQFSAPEAGQLFTTIPLITAVVGPFSGWLSDKIGSRFLSTSGLAIAAFGLFLLGGLGLNNSSRDIVLRLAVVALGMGLFQSPNNSAIMGSVPRKRLGIASGMVGTMRNVGMVLGMACAGTIFSSRIPYFLSVLKGGQMYIAKASKISAMHDAFLVSMAVCLVGVLTSMVRGKRRAGEQ